MAEGLGYLGVGPSVAAGTTVAVAEAEAASAARLCWLTFFLMSDTMSSLV